MEAYITKIMSLLNKPTHYLFIGLFFALWGYKYKNHLLVFIGISLFLFALASYTESIFRFISQKRLIKKNKEKIIRIYKNLPEKEQEIVNYCIDNHSMVFETTGFDDYDEAIRSLSAKGFAQNANVVLFVINSFVYETLEKERENIRNAK